jgi:protein TonB
MREARRTTRITAIRLALFALVAGVHILFIFFFVLRLEATATVPEAPVPVMKLTDIEEEIPPPPPPETPPEFQMSTTESVAETLIETEEPLALVVFAPQRIVTEQEDYLPMHKVSVPPNFSEQEILRRVIYPRIALRSGIEGTVYLDLFVDRQGVVRQVTVLKEDPPDRGFGEAAVQAFQGLRGKPGEANGIPVGVRYRYPLRFTIKR